MNPILHTPRFGRSYQVYCSKEDAAEVKQALETAQAARGKKVVIDDRGYHTNTITEEDIWGRKTHEVGEGPVLTVYTREHLSYGEGLLQYEKDKVRNQQDWDALTATFAKRRDEKLAEAKKAYLVEFHDLHKQAAKAESGLDAAEKLAEYPRLSEVLTGVRKQALIDETPEINAFRATHPEPVVPKLTAQANEDNLGYQKHFLSTQVLSMLKANRFDVDKGAIRTRLGTWLSGKMGAKKAN